MNTAAAAAEAQVTVATIRTWCRVGAVAAIKTAGRWVIDTASLAHRIAIGAMRTTRRKATAMETPDFTPLTRAEYSNDLGIRVRHYPTALSSGETLASDSLGVEDTPWSQRAFDQEACETALRAAGWTVTGTWTRKRAMMIAPVTSI